MSDLANCPFCGASADLLKSRIPKSVGFRAECSNGCAEVTRSGSDIDEAQTRAKVVDTWNRRALPPERGEEERLIEALKPFADLDSEGVEDYGDDQKITVQIGRSTHYALTLGHVRRLAAALAALEAPRS